MISYSIYTDKSISSYTITFEVLLFYISLFLKTATYDDESQQFNLILTSLQLLPVVTRKVIYVLVSFLCTSRYSIHYQFINCFMFTNKTNKTFGFNIAY